MESYQVPEITKKITEYDMIQMHTDLPNFPHYRTSLLYIFLDHSSRLNEHETTVHELYSLVTSLIQMGLDTHDMVDVKFDPTNNKQTRANQLRVLAGDYYSSRFYQLLAEKGQVNTIQLLSAAICEVNRLKMNLYLNMKHLNHADAEIIKLRTLIKMQLYIPFSQYMNEDLAVMWPELLYSTTFCEVVSEQLEQTKGKIEVTSLKEMLQSQGRFLIDQIKEIQYRHMAKDLTDLCEPLFIHSNVPQVLEEI